MLKVSKIFGTAESRKENETDKGILRDYPVVPIFESLYQMVSNYNVESNQDNLKNFIGLIDLIEESEQFQFIANNTSRRIVIPNFRSFININVDNQGKFYAMYFDPLAELVENESKIREFLKDSRYQPSGNDINVLKKGAMSYIRFGPYREVFLGL